MMKVREKKIKHFKYWKPLCSYHIIQIFAKISSEPYTPSGLLLGGTLPRKLKYIMDHGFLDQMYP